MKSDDIKATLSLVEEFERDGHVLKRIGSRLVCLCPFHREKTASCYVTPQRFRCFGCGAAGSVIDYQALKRGITAADAIAELAVHKPGPVESNGCSQRAKLKPPSVPRSARAMPRLPRLEKGSARDLSQLARLRKLAIEALKLARSRGLLWFADLKDGPETVRTWILADRTLLNAQARRVDGQPFRHTWDADTRKWVPAEPEKRRKVRGFTGNQASWPLGIEEAQSFNKIALVEGVDLLAAFHFLLAESRESAVAPVAILGASNRIPAEALKLFTGKGVRLFPHADTAGLRAAAIWETQLRPFVAGIDAFDLSRLTKTCGNPIKDLNDLTSIDPDCFESEPELRSLMSF